MPKYPLRTETEIFIHPRPVNPTKVKMVKGATPKVRGEYMRKAITKATDVSPMRRAKALGALSKSIRQAGEKSLILELVSPQHLTEAALGNRKRPKT